MALDGPRVKMRTEGLVRRQSLRGVNWRQRQAVGSALRAIYLASSEQAAQHALA